MSFQLVFPFKWTMECCMNLCLPLDIRGFIGSVGRKQRLQGN